MTMRELQLKQRLEREKLRVRHAKQRDALRKRLAAEKKRAAAKKRADAKRRAAVKKRATKKRQTKRRTTKRDVGMLWQSAEYPGSAAIRRQAIREWGPKRAMSASKDELRQWWFEREGQKR